MAQRMVVGRDGCTLCGSATVSATPANGYTARSCGGCGHLSFDAGQLDGTTDTYSHPQYAGFRPDPVFLESARLVLRRLGATIPMPARLLDVGCGSGAGLEAAESVGFAAHGIDTSVAAIHLCRERRLSAEVRSVDDSQLGDTWAVVTMWDVLEHIADPVAFISAVHARLKPGGFLVIKVPTVSAQGARAILRFAPRFGVMALQVPEHLNYFTRQSLSLLLEGSSFDMEHVSTIKSFRTRPTGGSIKRRAGRLINRFIMKVSRGRQLVVVARSRP